MNNLIKKLSYGVLFLVGLNLYSYGVRHVVKGGQGLGPLTGPLKAFVEFPVTVKTVLFASNVPEDHVPFDAAFEPINKLSYDLHALNAHFDRSTGNWVYQLRNLRDEAVVHDWQLTNAQYTYQGRNFDRAQPMGHVLLADRSIITTLEETANMYRLDQHSKVTWHNTDHQYHHDLNLDAGGNIWACTRVERVVQQPRGRDARFWDNGVAHIDATTGKTLQHISVADILVDNNLHYLVYGSANSTNQTGDDPLHLNDVEPVLKTGPYMQQGDLLMSFRHRSLILHYRPATNEVIRVIQGPFLSQHDVDVLSDSTISLFNNNAISLEPAGNLTANNPHAFASSQVLVYDLGDSSFTPVFSDQFVANDIYTYTQGLQTLLTNGDLFVESQNDGKIYVLSNQGVLFQGYWNAPIDGLVEPPRWIKIYEKLPF